MSRSLNTLCTESSKPESNTMTEPLPPTDWNDERCPQDCQHKAPEQVALMFADVYLTQGNKAAAAMAVAHKESA